MPEQETQITALQKVKGALVEKMPDFKALMPRGIAAERYVRQAYFAIAKDPKLQQCTPASLVMRTIEAAEVGLSLDRTLQEAALIPRYSTKKKVWEAQLMPEYKGLLRLAHQHPDVDHVDVVEVFNNDVFRVTRGTKPEIVHEVSTDADPGPAVAYYAIVWFKSGQCKFEVMNKRQIEGVRKHIKGASEPDSPWVKNYGEQAKKTVLKRMLKTVPRTEHTASALSASDSVDIAAPQETVIDLKPLDPREAEPPHGLDCRPGEDIQDAEVVEPPPEEQAPPAEEEPPPPSDEQAPPADEQEQDEEAAAQQEEEHLKDAQEQAARDAQEQALKDLGWDGPPLIQPDRALDDNEQKLVRDILRKEKVTAAQRGREWLEKQTGRKIQKLTDLTVLDLVPLLKKYYPDHVTRYVRDDPQQEML